MSSTDDFQFEPTDSGTFDGDVLTPGGPAITGARQADAGDNREGVLGPGPAINVSGGTGSGSKKKQSTGKRSKLPLLLAGGGLLAVLAALTAGGIYFGPQFLAQNDNGSQPIAPAATPQPAPAPQPMPVTTPTPGLATPGPAATGTPASETPAVEPAAPAPAQAASPLAAEFAAIESWNDASFETLYPLKDNFISSPLGKIYTALCNGELSFADQQRLYQWLEKQRHQPASENATFVFDMIENALSLQAAAPHSATFRQAARLGAAPQTWTGLLVLSQPFSMLSMSSLLAVDAELGFETESPVEMTPEQQERWAKKVEFLTAPLPPAVKATHLIDLVDFCLACNANSRALEVTVAAERWLHNLDTKQLNAKTQSQLLNLRSHLRTRHQQADQAVVIQQKQAELTMLVEQVQMAKTEADAARAAAEKAAATVTARGGGQAITPARLGELLGRLDARLAAIAPDKLPASVQDDPKQAYAKRWNEAGAAIKTLRDHVAAPDAAAAWTAAESQAITDQLQLLDSTLLSLQIDFAVMSMPPGDSSAPPLVWNRDQLKKAVAELKARWEKARTGLTDKRNAARLEPIFFQLESQLAAASLSPSQGAELVVALQDVASNVLQLETELAMTQTLARARSAGSGGQSSSGGPSASAGQLAELENALSQISQDNDQLHRRLNDLRAELDRVARAPRPVSPAEIEQAAAEATERAMDRLAQMGYTPLAGGPSISPPRIDPNLPEANPRLAREYAGTAYTLYYSGRSDELPQAIELFGQAVRHDASNPVYRYFLGLCLYRLGRASEAASQVRAGRDYERQSPDLHRPDSALARVQGPLRDWLESIRRGA